MPNPKPETSREREEQRLQSSLDTSMPQWWDELEGAKPCTCNAGREFLVCKNLSSDSWIGKLQCKLCKNKTRYYHEG